VKRNRKHERNIRGEAGKEKATEIRNLFTAQWKREEWKKKMELFVDIAR